MNATPSASASAPIRLAGRTLKQTRHICAFFNSREEQNKVLMPFFKEGFDRGEKLFHIVDSRLREDHLCGLPRAAASTSMPRRRAASSRCAIGRMPT